MNTSPAPFGHRNMVLVPCHISESDIEKMDYWMNEAPMADLATTNAIVFALARLVRPGLSLRLDTSTDGPGVQALVDGQPVALQPAVQEWWKRAIRGHRMGPIATTIWLPAAILFPRAHRNRPAKPHAEAA